ncbi:DUF1330 domain-containing protein [Streptomyces sp. NPDC059578]|uniref:DUF1330 domain-containing protein n=1 Tax=unclassified Streptomyces TaxID=2593676 RepID=UPI00365342C7
MTTYAICHLQPRDTPPDMAEIADYIERIQATMDPFGGRFLVHGVEPEVIEGPWPGAIVMIGFPDTAAARDWWDSDAYQELLPLRVRNFDCRTVLVPGVPDGYDASTTARKLRPAPAPPTD